MYEMIKAIAIMAMTSLVAFPVQGATTETCPLFDRQTQTLNAAELKPVLESWDRAVATDLLEQKEAAMLNVSMTVKVRGVKETTILKYGNPEIQDRMIELYQREMKRSPGKDKRFQSQAKVSNEERTRNPWYGAEEGYFELILELAESTFSDRIYSYELKPVAYYHSDLRLIYLAKVNPQKTLDCLLHATVGSRQGRKTEPDCIFSNDQDDKLIGSINEAFELLKNMCELSPETVAKNMTKIQIFVRKYAMYLSVPHEVSWHKDPLYSEELDLPLRGMALDILDHLGTQDDLPLIEKLADTPPLKKRVNNQIMERLDKESRETIKGKAARAKATLEKKAQEQNAPATPAKP